MTPDQRAAQAWRAMLANQYAKQSSHSGLAMTDLQPLAEHIRRAEAQAALTERARIVAQLRRAADYYDADRATCGAGFALHTEADMIERGGADEVATEAATEAEGQAAEPPTT